MNEDLFESYRETVARLLRLQEMLLFRFSMKQYRECIEAGGDWVTCMEQVLFPRLVIAPPPPVPPELMEAATYHDILEVMRANALETVEIIDRMMEAEPLF
jgi:hypothetical protein